METHRYVEDQKERVAQKKMEQKKKDRQINNIIDNKHWLRGMPGHDEDKRK